MTAKRQPHQLVTLAPSIGWPVTLCVLAYGPHAGVAERFLSTLYGNTDPELFHLRAGLNEVEPNTRKLFDGYARRFGNVTIFAEPRNVFKSPLMRRLFWRPAITTKWTVWCDDDTHFTRPDWLQRLGLKIEHSPEVSMWGKPYALWSTDDAIADWIKAASWYRGKPCVRAKNPNGEKAIKFRFAPGAFWAARTEVLQTLSWPDPRLVHANEDFLLGEALRQNNLRLGHFDYGVSINDGPRRNEEAPEVRELKRPPA